MTLIVSVAEATIFGIAAAISSLAGVGLAWAGHRASLKAAQLQAEKDTHDQLMEARREAEELSAELHKLRMAQNDPGQT
jgi:hypothetical protein